MVKVFDLEPGGLKEGGKAQLNEEESAKFNKEQEIRKEHEETNKGLAIELRNKIACPMMRVEFPKEIVEEIKLGVTNQTQEFKDNLDNVFKQIGKTFLRKAFSIEKQLKVDFRLYGSSDKKYNHKIKALLFTDGGNNFDFQWNSITDINDDHPLRPKSSETVTTEPGVLIIYPSYNQIVTTPPQEYLDKSPVIEVGIDYE